MAQLIDVRLERNARAAGMRAARPQLVAVAGGAAEREDDREQDEWRLRHALGLRPWGARELASIAQLVAVQMGHAALRRDDLAAADEWCAAADEYQAARNAAAAK